MPILLPKEEPLLRVGAVALPLVAFTPTARVQSLQLDIGSLLPPPPATFAAATGLARPWDHIGGEPISRLSRTSPAVTGARRDSRS